MHQGWKNYETWAVKLWLDNDRGDYEMMREKAAAVLEDNTDADGNVNDEAFGLALAEWLKEYHEEQAEEALGDGAATVFDDLLRAALSEVDWFEIAATYLGEAKENAAD